MKTADGSLFAVGKLGREVDIDTGKEAARICVLNSLTHIRNALGTLDKVVRVIKVCSCIEHHQALIIDDEQPQKVVGFVASAEGFHSQPLVVNGASELLISIFGDNGRHARSAIGVFELPLGVPVEVEMVLEVRD